MPDPKQGPNDKGVEAAVEEGRDLFFKELVDRLDKLSERELLLAEVDAKLLKRIEERPAAAAGAVGRAAPINEVAQRAIERHDELVQQLGHPQIGVSAPLVDYELRISPGAGPDEIIISTVRPGDAERLKEVQRVVIAGVPVEFEYDAANEEIVADVSEVPMDRAGNVLVLGDGPFRNVVVLGKGPFDQGVSTNRIEIKRP